MSYKRNISQQGASVLAVLTFIIVLVTLFVAVQGLRQASSAEDTANNLRGRVDSLSNQVEQLELEINPASPGGGVGPNVPTQPEGSSGNTMPNASGQ